MAVVAAMVGAGASDSEIVQRFDYQLATTTIGKSPVTATID